MLVLPLYCNYSESSEASETPDASQELTILKYSSSRILEVLGRRQQGSVTPGS